jgi:hypothetical protein
MNNHDDRRGMHRRTVLRRCLAGAAGLALAAGTARAQGFGKISKAEAAYIDVNQPPFRLCEQCQYFTSPDECSIVEGTINPLGTCDNFED